MIKLIDIPKESIIKYRVVFTDYGDEEFPTSRIFDSKDEAESWVESNEWEEHGVEEYDPRIDDYIFTTRTRYYNPEDKENYFGYSIEPISRVDESFDESIMKSHYKKISNKVDNIISKLKDRGYVK